MIDLTGCPVKSIILEEYEKEGFDMTELYYDLKEYDEQGFLMSAETSGFDD